MTDLSVLDLTQNLEALEFDIMCGFDDCDNTASWNVVFDYECSCGDPSEYACDECHNWIMQNWNTDFLYRCRCGVRIGVCAYADIVLRMEKIK